jgi:hypothetical protein
MNKDIINTNNKYQRHGYQEWYDPFNVKLLYRGIFDNSNPKNYIEWHIVKETEYHIT